jgi:hypothetical protein
MIRRLMRRVALRNFDDVSRVIFAGTQIDRMNDDAVDARANRLNDLLDPFARKLAAVNRRDFFRQMTPVFPENSAMP